VLILLRKKNLRERGLWVIFVYLCYSIVTEGINTYESIRYNSVLYLNFNLFSIVECILLAVYIHGVIRNKIFRVIIWVTLLLFVPYFIYNMLGPFRNNYDSPSTSIESILLLIYSIFYFFEQITNPNHIFFYSITEFWVIVAILLYFSGTFFTGLYAFGQLKSNTGFDTEYQVIVTSSDILKSLLLGVAMMVKGDTESNNIPKTGYRPRRTSKL